ncbi:Nickel uptake substrate-specific transmembrane region [Stieleria neptunia]|uniref:Nickel uptake substrate-specific transmembrane region n=1 Tax=Stieleria neptunia TaxID=2527979 RepID=A0A518I3Y9_9BACT|nr:carboxypeptidase regulatory-like domain-containing protein [Stieleria neptunia]QDV47757.1 Nickel uptake substrate-specific transmembrane region [Stieleria neptunia]
MPTDKTESQLERLADNWPGDSVLEEVMSRLPKTSTPTELPRPFDWSWPSWIGALATIVVFAASLWVTMPNTNDADQADRQQPLKHMVAEPPQSERESWDDEPTALPHEISGLVVDHDGKPIAGADVTVRIRRFGAQGENSGPGPWKATTDDQGQYSVQPSGPIRRTDEVRIRVIAEGFAELSAYDHEKKLLNGSFPHLTLTPGRMIVGQLVDDTGKAITKAVVRFQHNSETISDTWDSGPLAVDKDGKFAVSIPVDGKAVGVVYPVGYAPRFIEVGPVADQGNIVMDAGVTLKGRVLDRSGNGVAGTVVGFRDTEHREMFGYVAVIGSAVKTDADGYFQLPPLRGSYELTVSKSAPDYSRQMMLVGVEPPSFAPLTMNTASVDPKELIVLKESKSH